MTARHEIHVTQTDLLGSIASLSKDGSAARPARCERS